MKPLFSVAIITRNEQDTLPKAIASLHEFQATGGEVVVVDTGSTDNTINVATSLGCKTIVVGNKFRLTVSDEQADAINKLATDETPIVHVGGTAFDFSSARNFAANLCSNDMVCFMDADEQFTKFDLDKINEYIKNGYTQIGYNFVFSHDASGNESMKFVQSKFYNKQIMKWECICHEYLSGQSKRINLSEDIIKLEHWKNHATDRSHYLTGLAIDLANNQRGERQTYYFARELFYEGRWGTAIDVFKRYLAFSKYYAERCQARIFIGDCCAKLNRFNDMIFSYWKAIEEDDRRRGPWMKLANYYLSVKHYQKALCYAMASTEIPFDGHFACHKPDYEYKSYEIIYKCQLALGRKADAKNYILKCLEYRPTVKQYWDDLNDIEKLPSVIVYIQWATDDEIEQIQNEAKSRTIYPKLFFERSILNKLNLDKYLIIAFGREDFPMITGNIEKMIAVRLKD